MKKYSLLISTLLMAVASFSQSTNVSTFLYKNVRKADHLFQRHAYRNALEIYLHLVDRDPDDRYVRERVGHCYLKLNDPVAAELWLRSVCGQPGTEAESVFLYADVLSTNGKYDESRRWFSEYLKLKPGDKVAIDKIDFLNNIEKYISDDDRIIVSTFDHNTAHAEYGAHFFHDGIVFASSRDTKSFIKHKPSDGTSADESLMNLYYARKNEMGAWDHFEPYAIKPLMTNYHDGPVAFYDNFTKAAFTQSNMKRGKPVYDGADKVNLQIYFATLSGSGDFEDVIPFKYNSDAYSNAHPSFSRDGKTMYFCSTMPAGFGGSDLYYSTFIDGRWTEPVNIGEDVNTRRNESFPFIANDTTLYFSSNGHGGFGGADLYVSYRRAGKFSAPVNLGTPLNTRFDDFSLVCDSLGRSGFFASNGVDSRGSDDIYHYTATSFLLAGEVRDLIHGDAKISGVRIEVFNGNGDRIGETHSDSSGRFIVPVPFDQDFIIRSEKQGFETRKDVAFSTKGKIFSLDTIMVPVRRQDLFAKGRIFSNESQSILPGAAVVFRDLTTDSADTVIVNEHGEYHFPVRHDTKYRVEGLKNGYVDNGFNLDTRGLDEGELLNDIVLEEIFIDKQVILFDYDKFVIGRESAKALDQIVETLKTHPAASVKISTHSDSRGSAEYNAQLSMKRAQSARRYLLAGGIGESRIEINWFGEELILNRCSDGVECPEEEHSKNRRAEIKVQRE